MATDGVEITVKVKFTISLWDLFKLRLGGCKSERLAKAIRFKIDGNKEANK